MKNGLALAKRRRGRTRSQNAARNAHDFTEITTFIGQRSEILLADGRTRSPLCTHVATVSWSWSPAHSRTSQYRIATDRGRKMCISTKWLITWIPESPYAHEWPQVPLIVACCLSTLHLPFFRQLGWRRSNTGFRPRWCRSCPAGLLDGQDVDALVADLRWINSVTWLQYQSRESLSALRAHLPKPPDEWSTEAMRTLSPTHRNSGCHRIICHSVGTMVFLPTTRWRWLRYWLNMLPL